MKNILVTFVLIFSIIINIQAQNNEELRIKEMINFKLSTKYKLVEDTSFKNKTIKRGLLYGLNKPAPLDGIQSQHIFELPIKGVDYKEGDTYNLSNVSDSLLEGIEEVYKIAGSDVVSAEINKYCIEFVSVGEKRLAVLALINSRDANERTKDINRQLGLF